jgi:hypothetical protein
MRRVKFAEALDRGEHRPHQEEIAEELVPPAVRQIAIMRGVVSHDDQRVLARADEYNREHVEHRVPEIGAERDGGGNRDPFSCGRGKRSRSVQLRQVFDDRGRQALGDSPAGVVGMYDDWIGRNVLRRNRRPKEGDSAVNLGEVRHRSRYARLLHKAVAHSCLHF